MQICEKIPAKSQFEKKSKFEKMFPKKRNLRIFFQKTQFAKIFRKKSKYFKQKVNFFRNCLVFYLDLLSMLCMRMQSISNQVMWQSIAVRLHARKVFFLPTIKYFESDPLPTAPNPTRKSKF